ncbi:MAG TPA: hypothetical protein VHJ20_06635 [Polyangia bacterium]|nr:hypothetical protein [Polyangia bacterium]
MGSVGCGSGTSQRPATADGDADAAADDSGGSGGTSDAVADASANGGANAAGSDGGDAAPSDVALDSAGDAGDDAADVSPGPCGHAFCEDFELGQIDPTKWRAPAIGTATMTVQTKIVAHGTYAVQFHGDANPASADYVYLITKAAPAALQKHSFGRAYFYLSPQRNDIDMGLVFAGTAGFPKPTYMSIANHGTGWQLGFIKLSGAPGGETQTYPPGDIPVAKWLCLEWEVNDEPDEINVWGDGKPIGTLSKDSKVGFCSGGCSQPVSLYDNKTSNLIGAFTDFGFGFYDWHPTGRPAFDVYYDDIVLDVDRVGCLP